MSKFVLVDGNAIVHRAYHAIPPLTTKEGVLVNAVYGFVSMLLKVWKDLKPEYLAVTFDVAGGTFRHDKFEKYKATRVKADQDLYDQIPLVHQVVEVFGIPIFEKKGFEADDVIGTIATQCLAETNKKTEVYIVTGDMDTLQLVNEQVKVYTLRKGLNDIVVYDPAEVRSRYGFGPEMIVDYKALRGDTSDNISGVPGIGEKTATELIQKIGGIQEIYHELGNQKSSIFTDFKPGVIKKLQEGQAAADMSRYLATIDLAVPDLGFTLETCRIKPFDKEKIIALFQKFEFISLLKRLPDFAGNPAVTEEKKATRPSAPRAKQTRSLEYVEVATVAEVQNLADHIKQHGSFAARLVTNGNDLFSATLSGALFVVEHHGYFVPQRLFKNIQHVFADPVLTLNGHDLKQLLKVASVHKIEIKNKLFDVMVASYLLNPGSRAHDPASVVLKVLGKELLVGGGQESLFGADTKTLAHELFLLSETVPELTRELKAIDDYGLIEKIEMPLSIVLAEMELNGVAVDPARLVELSKKTAKALAACTKKIYALSGEEFNIASPIQLREVLFEKMNIPVEGIKKGKTGLSTSAEELEKLRDLHPIINEISEFRELSKLQNTYIDVLPTLVNPTTHRIHTTYNQAVAATGRLSSTDPNLQNIPVRTELGREVRTAFVAEKGNILLSADYSQIELRIVASLAEDQRMIDIFSEGLDIHQATAAAINNVPLENVTREMRYAAKEVNFGVLYGMGTHGLSWRAGIPYLQAKEFIEKYFEQFSGVKKYLDRTIAFAAKDGYCETLFGRRRYIPELGSKNHQLRAAGERMAVNHPVQGTAADLMKMGMIDVYKKLHASKFGADVKMILQVHDELVVEVAKGLEKDVGALLKATLENVVKLRVPVKVDLKTGQNWGEMEK